MSRRLLLIAAVGLIAVPLLPFDLMGSDDQAAAAVEATGYQPWAAPLFEPSEAAEPWLFAVQAALGVGLFAVALRRRRSPRA